MVETWRDSWFEEGSRVLYVVPQAETDAILPLHITPAPTRIARVFVGRLELMTPFMTETIERALRTNDAATLERYGRFLQPVANRITSKMAPADRQKAEAL